MMASGLVPDVVPRRGRAPTLRCDSCREPCEPVPAVALDGVFPHVRILAPDQPGRGEPADLECGAPDEAADQSA